MEKQGVKKDIDDFMAKLEASGKEVKKSQKPSGEVVVNKKLGKQAQNKPGAGKKEKEQFAEEKSAYTSVGVVYIKCIDEKDAVYNKPQQVSDIVKVVKIPEFADSLPDDYKLIAKVLIENVWAGKFKAVLIDGTEIPLFQATIMVAKLLEKQNSPYLGNLLEMVEDAAKEKVIKAIDETPVSEPHETTDQAVVDYIHQQPPLMSYQGVLEHVLKKFPLLKESKHLKNLIYEHYESPIPDEQEPEIGTEAEEEGDKEIIEYIKSLPKGMNKVDVLKTVLEKFHEKKHIQELGKLVNQFHPSIGYLVVTAHYKPSPFEEFIDGFTMEPEVMLTNPILVKTPGESKATEPYLIEMPKGQVKIKDFGFFTINKSDDSLDIAFNYAGNNYLYQGGFSEPAFDIPLIIDKGGSLFLIFHTLNPAEFYFELVLEVTKEIDPQQAAFLNAVSKVMQAFEQPQIPVSAKPKYQPPFLSPSVLESGIKAVGKSPNVTQILQEILDIQKSVAENMKLIEEKVKKLEESPAIPAYIEDAFQKLVEKLAEAEQSELPALPPGPQVTEYAGKQQKKTKDDEFPVEDIPLAAKLRAYMELNGFEYFEIHGVDYEYKYAKGVLMHFHQKWSVNQLNRLCYWAIKNWDKASNVYLHYKTGGFASLSGCIDMLNTIELEDIGSKKKGG